MIIHFFFDTTGAKKIVIGSQARRKSLCEFAKKKHRFKNFALCGARGGGESWAMPKFSLPLGSLCPSTPQAFEKA